MPDTTFAARLRTLRESRGWPVAELAARAGVDRATVWRLERGSHRPQVRVLELLAGALGVPAGDLLR